MSILDRKLGRDLWRMRWQALSIAIVVACAVASFVAAVTTYRSLFESRDAFYTNARLAHLFVHVERAPLALLARVRDVPGVSEVDGRIAEDGRLELDGTTEPITARFVSIDAAAASPLNGLVVRSGRGLRKGAADEIVLSELFAEAHAIEPGASINAIIKGTRHRLRVVGVGTSPEFVWAVPPRTGLPDAQHFGVAWADYDTLARMTGEEGTFNDAVIELVARTDVEEAKVTLDRLLAPYGSRGAVRRSDVPSAKLVDQKVEQLQKLASVLPLIFLGVAGFLLNMLLARIVGSQREQIATLKALGYRSRELAVHYVSLAAIVCAFGGAAGAMLGALGAKGLLRVYAVYFRFPSTVFRLDLRSLAIGIVVTAVFALGGAWLGVRRAVAVPPAEAMKPEPPASFGRTPLDRLGLYRFLSPAARMVLRESERRPVRTILSGASVALATAIVVIGGVSADSVDEVLRLEYEVVERQDLAATLNQPVSAAAVHEIEHVPGVLFAEGERSVAVRLHAGRREKTSALLGIEPDRQLHGLLNAERQPLVIPGYGVALSRPLANTLGVLPGDTIEIESLEAGGKTIPVEVSTIVDDLIGLYAYMDGTELRRAFGEVSLVNRILMRVDRAALDDVAARIEAMPAVAAISRPDVDRDLFRAEVTESYLVMQIMLAGFATAIAVGVVYNNARIALDVRSRDLATLRILGFTRRELATVLLGEQALQLILGIVPGLLLGKWLGARMLSAIDPELMRVPMTLSPTSQLRAAAVVVVAAVISALRVRARSDKLDLVAVLKARD